MGSERSDRVWPAWVAVTGQGQGAALLLDKPLSFWGGYDVLQGCIVEPGHPQHGARLGGRVMLMSAAKGSSSSSSVLAEAIRQGTGPAAIVMRERDLIVGLGCIVAAELYGHQVPMVVLDEAAWQALGASIVSIGAGPCNLTVEATEAGTGGCGWAPEGRRRSASPSLGTRPRHGTPTR